MKGLLDSCYVVPSTLFIDPKVDDQKLSYCLGQHVLAGGALFTTTLSQNCPKICKALVRLKYVLVAVVGSHTKGVSGKERHPVNDHPYSDAIYKHSGWVCSAM